MTGGAPLPRPRAVLFDWDNTLVDTWGLIQSALNHTLVTLGREPWSREEVRQRVRASARDSFPVLFGQDAEKATQIFYERFEATHLDELNPLPDAEALLRGLAGQGIALGLVSNKLGRLLRLEVQHLGWEGLFNGVVGATDAPRDKPAVEPVYLALEGSGVEPGPEVWFVGDTDIDMLCAHNAGCRAVLLRPEPPGEGEFEAAPPQAHFLSCGALAKAPLTP